MDTKTFIIATNGHLKWRLHHKLEDLSPEQLGYRTPLIDDRPIAEVAMHATVILLGTATVAAGKPWELQDYPLDGWPPMLAQPDSTAALVEMLDSLLAEVDELVTNIPDGALDQEVMLPWGQQQAGDALSVALVHALTHAGGMAGIRALGAFLFRQDTDDTGSRREPSRRPGKIVTRLQRLVLRAAL
jgi:DinB superfamily